MTAQTQPFAPTHTTNGVHAEPAATEVLDESKKEKKKRKKKEKKASEREREVLFEQLDAAHPRLDGHPQHHEGHEAPAPQPAIRIQAWLRQVSGTLDTHRILTAHKSSFLIAINCVMLSIAAHAIYGGLAAGPLQWVLLPLGLTNVLSLTFAILSAQVGQKLTRLDELWAMPDDEYEPAVASMLQDKQRVYETISHDLHLVGAELNKRQKHLRTAYNVLLGGIAASACLFAICAAMGPV